MKILHIAASSRTFVRFRLPILLQQRQIGHEVYVACRFDLPYIDQIIDLGFPVIEINMPDTQKFKISVFIKSLNQLRENLKNFNFDIIHSHQPTGNLIGTIIGSYLKIPLIFHTTGGLKSNENMSFLSRQVYSKIESVILRRNNAIFSVNKEDIDTMVATMKVKSENVYYVGPRGGCGIDTTMFATRNRPKKELRVEAGLTHIKNSLIIGAVGRVVKEKGYKELISAFSLVKDQYPQKKLHLVIIGEGKDSAEMESLAESYGISKFVLFLGRRNDMPLLLNCLDIFVLPSYREGMPTSLLEAMSVGIPCITTNIRGGREIVLDSVNGFLVSPKNSQAIQEKIIHFIENPKQTQQIAALGQRTVVTDYSKEVLLNSHIAQIESIIKCYKSKRD